MELTGQARMANPGGYVAPSAVPGNAGNAAAGQVAGGNFNTQKALDWMSANPIPAVGMMASGAYLGGQALGGGGGGGQPIVVTTT